MKKKTLKPSTQGSIIDEIHKTRERLTKNYRNDPPKLAKDACVIAKKNGMKMIQPKIKATNLTHLEKIKKK